ncbi:MAG TPA: serine hydrolase [Luteibacter sp.]|jgi:CubicO group peptidase (beta-lactamase class C family)|nr:serine hydrolase [Luteibacter sp.]
MSLPRVGRSLLTAAFALALSAPLAAQDAVSFQDMAAYVNRARERLDVPGIAIAVVKDGKVVFEQGFGERSLGGHEPVDAHTLFCIASNTKSFTATAMEMLDAEGKLKMNDRVIDHLPWFRMSEPYATNEIRLRDLLAHRSGLGPHAGDLLFLPATSYSTREVVERLHDFPLATGFRNSFAYENIMYAVATLVIEQASGQSYADFVSQHIFAPVGMSESRIDATYLKPGDNVATAHMPDDDGKLAPVAPLAWKNASGAAGIYSTVHDMARWMLVQLDGGKLPDGSARLFSADNQKRMWSTITPIDVDDPAVPALAAAQPISLGYAEGWYNSDYRGRHLVWHDGGFPGMVSKVMLVPSMHLGVVVLTNQEAEGAFDAIVYHVLDAYMHAPATDWVGAYADAAALSRKKIADRTAAVAASRSPTDKPSQPLAKYAGRYNDRWYGDIDVSMEHGGLRIDFTKSQRMLGSLQPWKHDTFLVHWDDSQLHADAFIDFDVAADGSVHGAHMRRAQPRTAAAYDYQDLNMVRVGATEKAGESR